MDITTLKVSPLEERYQEILAKKSVLTLTRTASRASGFQVTPETARVLGEKAMAGALSPEELILTLFKGKKKVTAAATDFARTAGRKIETQQRLRQKLEARRG